MSGPLDFGPDAEQRPREAEEEQERPPVPPRARPPEVGEAATRTREPRRTDAERLFVGDAREGGGGGPASFAVSSKYTWFVGLVFLVVIVVAGINAIGSNGHGARGLQEGDRAPVFAAPLATGTLDGDVNLARKANGGSSGHVPACDVRGPSVLNGCDLFARGPAAIAFFVTGSGRCVRMLDQFEAARRRHRGVGFAAVAIKAGRSKTRDAVAAHRWGFPVAYDRDGAMSNSYAIAVCPVVTYVRRGGIVAGTRLGDAAGRDLERDLTAIEAGRPLPPA